MKVTENDKGNEVSLHHPSEVVARGLLMEALGTADSDFAEGIVNQLIRAATHRGKISERELNFLLSIIKGIKPTDAVETMLFAQMAAVHVTAMQFGVHFSQIESYRSRTPLTVRSIKSCGPS